MGNYIEEMGSVRRRPNPQNILPSQEETTFDNPFSERFPIGSLVWKDTSRHEYGTLTKFNVWSNDPNDITVVAENINGLGTWACWLAKYLVVKQDDTNEQ